MEKYSSHYFQNYDFCPQCGAKYDDDDKMFGPSSYAFICHSCKHRFYQHATPATTCIIPNSTDKLEVLVTRRAIDPNKGKLDIPGGFVDYPDSPEEAVKREIKEELGVELEEVTLFMTGVVEYKYQDMLKHVIVITYISNPVDPDAIKVDLKENSEFQFVDIDELINNTSDFAWEYDRLSVQKYKEFVTNP